MAKADSIQGIFGVRSKQDGLNPDCGMRSRKKKKPVRSKREARRHKRVAEKEDVGGEREPERELFRFCVTFQYTSDKSFFKNPSDRF